jgi:hypothetical protein
MRETTNVPDQPDDVRGGLEATGPPVLTPRA